MFGNDMCCVFHRKLQKSPPKARGIMKIAVFIKKYYLLVILIQKCPDAVQEQRRSSNSEHSQLLRALERQPLRLHIRVGKAKCSPEVLAEVGASGGRKVRHRRAGHERP